MVAGAATVTELQPNGKACVAQWRPSSRLMAIDCCAGPQPAQPVTTARPLAALRPVTYLASAVWRVQVRPPSEVVSTAADPCGTPGAGLKHSWLPTMAIPFRLSVNATAVAVLFGSSVGSVTGVQSRPAFWLTRRASPSTTTTDLGDSTRIVGVPPLTGGPDPRIGGSNGSQVCPASVLLHAPVAAWATSHRGEPARLSIGSAPGRTTPSSWRRRRSYAMGFRRPGCGRHQPPRLPSDWPGSAARQPARS